MKAMILAAGYGTRLGELGKTLPKCLLEAGGKTMLEHVIERLMKVGVNDFVINLHHLGEKIIAYLESKGNFGVKIKFSKEHIIQGTGGGIRCAKDLLGSDQSFFVHNADIYSEFDLSQIWNRHQQSGAMATLAVMKRDTSRPLLFDQNHCLKGWIGESGKGAVIGDKTNLNKLAFSGIQVLSPEIFEHFDSFESPFSSISAYMRASELGATVLGHEFHNSFWMDVGTPEKIEALRRHFDGAS